MRPEELSKIRRDLEPPWNDLREQRVLGRIQEARRRSLRRPARLVVGATAFGAALLVAVWAVRPRALAPAASADRDPRAEAREAGLASGEQRMSLADGSQAVLVRDAQVEVRDQRPDRVHIAQRSGEVRYEVRPDRSREFAVFAAGTTVRVRGTIFTVDVERDHVEVRVERGEVEVDDGMRSRELVVGESLRVPVRATGGAVASAPGEEEQAQGTASSSVEAPAADQPVPAPPVEPSRAPPAAGSGGGARAESADLTFDGRMAKADDARAAGRKDDAARILEQIAALYPRDSRLPSVLFALGKVQRARRDDAASARAFERCLRTAPQGPLAEDALAEAAASWAAAGRADASRSDAQRYLDRWPTGTQAAQMRAIVER